VSLGATKTPSTMQKQKRLLVASKVRKQIVIESIITTQSIINDGSTSSYKKIIKALLSQQTNDHYINGGHGEEKYFPTISLLFF